MVEMFGAANVALRCLGWLVYLAGAVVALIFVVRRKDVASVLALIGFGLPLLVSPILVVLQYVLPQRMGVAAGAARTLLGIDALQSLVGIASTLFLVGAFWFALRDDKRM